MSSIHLELLDKKRQSALKKVLQSVNRICFKKRTWREYFYIFYFLYKKYFTLQQIINFAERKFKVEFNPALLLEQLIYYEDIQDQRLTFHKEKFSPESIKKFLFETVKNYRQKIISK